MLKIGKGLKKKKKNKKGKGKNEELFTEEELEQYRKEHTQNVTEEAASSSAASEEFEKFKQLTAGVDDILKKSQGDLDRIKKESFYQRKPTPSELKALEEKEKAELEKSEGNWIGFEEDKNSNKVENKEEDDHFEEESESEVEDNDDIFDTAYVDVLESGEIKLAHIPDDEELGFNDGPDPFDTTSADEILRKAEEEEKRKKKEISLGSAVSVLTGRADRDKNLIEDSGDPEIKRARARPRKIQDFCLLGSFDSESGPTKNIKEVAASELGAPETVDVIKSLLDDDEAIELDLPEGDALITEVLVKQAAKPPPPELATPVLDQEIVAEFELGIPPVDLEIKKLEEEDEFDEFSALAASSIVNQKLEEELQQYLVAQDDPFDTSGVNAVLKEETDPFESIEGEVKAPTEVPQVVPKGWSAFDEVPTEVDPFDTTFAADCAPGKAELRILEKEILESQVIQPVLKKADIHLEARILSRNNSEDFNPREGEGSAVSQHQRHRVSIQITNPSGETQRGSESEDISAVTLGHRDLLGGSTTDLSNLSDEPIPPASSSPTEDLSIRYSDPFDTSLADQATAPGRAELRFIENELLSDIPDVISDEDFDPRAGDDSFQIGAQKVSFDIPSPATSDLLSNVREGGGRPLTPYYTDAQSVSAESDIDVEFEDPFDTTHVTSLPGKQELKLIEQELDSVSIAPTVFQPIHEKLGLTQESSESIGIKHSLSDENFNPRSEEPTLQVIQPAPRRFSDISGLHNPPRTLPLRTFSSEDTPDLLAVEEEFPDKALTPAAEEDISSYVDPFDTSIAENIVPGKAELKVLEVELVGSITRSYTDPDFNPRDAPAAEGRLKTVPSTKPLTPIDLSVTEIDIDPFDTSIANNLGPGRTELRLLESELVGQ